MIISEYLQRMGHKAHDFGNTWWERALKFKIKRVLMMKLRDQLNMALILLSKVWSSKLSILIAWKYSLGSK